MQRAEPSDRESVLFEVSIRCYCNESLGINAKPSACALHNFQQKNCSRVRKGLRVAGGLV